MKNDRSPGTDGFTEDIFKFFWIDLKSFIIRTIKTAYETGEMSIINKLGIITCIPKQDKSEEYSKNNCPITLLTVIYKIVTRCIVERIKRFFK